MAARISITLALALSLSLSLAAGCGGGSGAALQIAQYPGDVDASPRRLEALARTFEGTFPCTETDTIVIQGMARGMYSVSGCTAMRDYMMSCRPGPYSGQICGWEAMPDLAQQAAIDMNCGAAYLEITPTGGPMQRTAEGCGFRAVYTMQCSGGCSWMLAGRIEQTGAPGGQGVAVQGQGSYTQ